MVSTKWHLLKELVTVTTHTVVPLLIPSDSWCIPSRPPSLYVSFPFNERSYTLIRVLLFKDGEGITSPDYNSWTHRLWRFFITVYSQVTTEGKIFRPVSRHCHRLVDTTLLQVQINKVTETRIRVPVKHVLCKWVRVCTGHRIVRVDEIVLRHLTQQIFVVFK